MCAKYRADPHNTEYTGSYYGARRRKYGMTAASQHSCRDLVETAYRLKQQYAHDTDNGIFHDKLFRCKKTTEKVTEYDNRRDHHNACQERKNQTKCKYFFTAGSFSGRVILAGEGRCRLSEGCDAIVGKIFKVHGNRAAGDGKSTEAVD